MNFDVNYLALSPARSEGGAGEKYELVLGIPVRTPAERRGEVSRASERTRPTPLYKSVDPKISIFALTSPLSSSLPSLPVALHSTPNQAIRY